MALCVAETGKVLFSFGLLETEVDTKTTVIVTDTPLPFTPLLSVVLRSPDTFLGTLKLVPRL